MILSFTIALYYFASPQVVCIEPVTGYFQPGNSVACKVTFCSHSSPSFYDMDVLCQVTSIDTQVLSPSVRHMHKTKQCL